MDHPSTERTPPVVDAHAHVFRKDLPTTADAWTRLEYDFTGDDYLAELDRHGVQHGVISALSITGTYHDYTIEQVRGRPRLRATLIADPQADLPSLTRMRDAGIVGMRLQLTRRATPLDLRTDDMRALFRRMRDLDWHVQVAIEGPLLPPVLDALDEAGVKVVLDHFGHPDPAKGAACDGFVAMLKAIERGRTWVKLSAGFRLLGTESWRSGGDLSEANAFARELAGVLLARVGPDRLLWGSDCPFVGYETRVTYPAVLDAFYDWVPSPSDRRAMSDAALKLYFS